jgi:PKD repeat protein
LQIAVADPDVEVPPTELPRPPEDSEPNEPPTVALSASTARGSAPLTVSFSADASDPDGDPLSYAWTFGNGDTAEGNSSHTVTYREPGDYTAVVTVSDGVAEERASFTVEVDEPPEPPASNTPPVVTLSATPVTGSTPLRVKLSADASDADGDEVSYLWDFGDGTISSDNPVTHVYRDAGDYSASVTVSDRRGGKTREEVTIEAVPRRRRTHRAGRALLRGVGVGSARVERKDL